MAHDGLYKALIDGKQGKTLENGGNFGGNKPPMYAGASETSQLHSQGKNTEDPNPTTFAQKNATSLNFKSSTGHSQFDLDGQTPTKYSDKIKPGELDLH